MSATILVIDDDQPIRYALELLFRTRGYQVLGAEDGGTGFEAFKEHRPDIVVTDIIMPGHEGIETIMRIKSIAPDVPIIAMSGGGRVGQRDFLAIARDNGADACLCKPFDPGALIALIAELLEARRTA